VPTVRVQGERTPHYGPHRDSVWIRDHLTLESVASVGSPTIVSPGDDVAAKITAAGTGGTLFFNKGIYRPPSIGFDGYIPLNGQTFLWERGPLGTPADTATFRGSIVLSSWVQDGSDWRHDGQTQDFGTPETIGGNGQSHDNPLCDVRETFFMGGVWLEHVANRAALGLGKVFFNRTTDQVWIRDNPTGHTVEATVSPRMWKSTIAGSVSDVTVRGGVIEHCGNGCFDIQESTINWLIEDLECRWARIPLSIRTVGGVTVRRARVTDGGRYAFTASSSPTLSLENVEIARGNYAGYGKRSLAPYDEGATKITGSDDVLLRGLWVHDNDGTGLWFDFGNDRADVAESVFERNTGTNFFHEANSPNGGQHQYNYYGRGGIDPAATSLPVNRGRWDDFYAMGYRLAGGGSNIHHNLFEQLSDSSGPALWYVDFPSAERDCSNNNVHENLFRYDAPRNANSLREVVTVRAGEAAWEGFGVMDSNRYELADTAEEIFNIPPQALPTRTFAEMQAAGYEAHGTVALL
jgi:hypothetical protein